MKTVMRQAFEDCKVPKNPTKGQLELASRIINRMEKADDNSRRKRVRKAPAVSEVRQ